MSGHKLSRRALLSIVVAGVLGAVLAGTVGLYVTSVTEKRYRAEMELALTPGPETAPERISDYWEALSRGQASRIAAEVLSHRRWREPAAAAAGVRPAKISVTSGVIADTSLITVGVEAPTPKAAETAVEALVREAAPTAEEISGPFALQVVQTAAGGAALVSTPRWQTLGLSVLAGIMIGSGSMLLVQRARARRPAAPTKPGATGGATPQPTAVTTGLAGSAGKQPAAATPATAGSVNGSTGLNGSNGQEATTPRREPGRDQVPVRPSPGPLQSERTVPAISSRREYDAAPRPAAGAERAVNGAGHGPTGVPAGSPGPGPRPSGSS